MGSQIQRPQQDNPPTNQTPRTPTREGVSTNLPRTFSAPVIGTSIASAIARDNPPGYGTETRGRIFSSNEDVDLLLRSKDGVQFHVHLSNLRSNSPYFADMLTPPLLLPLSPPSNTPVLDVEEDSETLDLLLQFMYPVATPSLKTGKFSLIRSLFVAARKYEVYRAIEVSTTELRNFASKQPFVVYTIASSTDPPDEELAKEASRYTLGHKLTSLKPSYFASLPGLAVHQLVELWLLHATRIEAGREILLSTPLQYEFPLSSTLPTASQGPPAALHAGCQEQKILERFWFEETRKVCDELTTDMDIANRLTQRDPPNLNCVNCYRILLRTTDVVRKRWLKVPDCIQ